MKPMMKPPSDGAGDVADAAEDGRRERLQAGVEAEVEADEAEAQAPDDAGRAGERAADEEGQRDRLVEVDAHQRGGLAGPGPWRASPGPAASG